MFPLWGRKSIPVMRRDHPGAPHPGRMMDRKKYSLGFAPVHLSLGTGHDSGPGDGINCLFTELYVFVFNC